MTPAQAVDELERTGGEVPESLRERARLPQRRRITLRFGDSQPGRAVLAVEFDADAMGKWGKWMQQRMHGMGGELSYE